MNNARGQSALHYLVVLKRLDNVYADVVSDIFMEVKEDGERDMGTGVMSRFRAVERGVAGAKKGRNT